jgi:hypothetical protein
LGLIGLGLMAAPIAGEVRGEAAVEVADGVVDEVFLDTTNRNPAGGMVGRTVSTTPRMLPRAIGSLGVTTAERDNF